MLNNKISNGVKIAIPTNNKKGLDDTIAEHFGRCQTYTFLDEKGEVLDIIENDAEHEEKFNLPPELIKKHGADILLCRDLGPRALNLCRELGIKVYVFKAERVGDIFNLWKENKNKEAEAEDVCEQHKL